MPYTVRHKGTKGYLVIDGNGDVRAASKSKAKADQAARVLRSIERKWKPGQDPNTYTRRINGKLVMLRVTSGTRGRSDNGT
jgi:hypothetical protein